MASQDGLRLLNLNSAILQGYSWDGPNLLEEGAIRGVVVLEGGAVRGVVAAWWWRGGGVVF